LNSLRNRLIGIFLAATLAPLAVTLWITVSLLDQSLNLASTRELDEISQSLQTTGRALYRQSRESLKAGAKSGTIQPQRFDSASRSYWPEPVREFYDSGESERVSITGAAGENLTYYTHRGSDVLAYTQPLGGPGMKRLAAQNAQARRLVDDSSSIDLRKGFLYTFVSLAAAVWLASLVFLVYSAYRVSRPIQQLTEGLSQLAAGNLRVRLATTGDDEVARAMFAFNHSAEQLQRSRDRVIHFTRLASWQTLARKMAHEVKNSLTPIRLTMEELVARRGENDQKFLEQAAQIVVDEVGTLERRVRAFSDFAAEPPIRLTPVDVNALIEERIAFLKSAHPEVSYNMRLAHESLHALADEDLIKGVLTNLLENAAEAAGGGGVVLGKTFAMEDKVGIEIHDSGPGLSPHARTSLFEPTISFKKTGMGLGLSIARKSALLSGGDILLVEGELGGAAFRILLPAQS
jgi:two-component system nitrogen regulation sensor histidine kinase NtrY